MSRMRLATLSSMLAHIWGEEGGREVGSNIRGSLPISIGMLRQTTLEVGGGRGGVVL